MQGSMKDIVKLRYFLANIGVSLPNGTSQKLEITDLQDPTISSAAQQSQGSPLPNEQDKGNIQTSFSKWVQQHTTNSDPDDTKVGTIEIKVLVISPNARGPMSPWLDPVDTVGSGLVQWTAQQLKLI